MKASLLCFSHEKDLYFLSPEISQMTPVCDLDQIPALLGVSSSFKKERFGAPFPTLFRALAQIFGALYLYLCI